MSTIKQREQAESIEQLRKWIKPGDTVWTTLNHVSASGMSRHIGVKLIPGKDDVRHIEYHVARALGYKQDPHNDGLKVSGAGMDMGFHIVYGLARTLFGEGFHCIGANCPSNDHSNDYGDLARQYDSEHGGFPTIEQRSTGERVGTEYVAARQQWIADQEPRLRDPQRVHTDGGYALTHRWL